MAKVDVRKIKSNEFAVTVKNILDGYDAQVATVTRLAVVETADWAVKQLHKKGDFKGTKYKKSWTKKVIQTRLATQALVHNKKEYRLTHLLEFGHAKQNGGRTREFPHIAPVAQEAEKIFIERIKANISGIDSIFAKGGMK